MSKINRDKIESVFNNQHKRLDNERIILQNKYFIARLWSTILFIVSLSAIIFFVLRLNSISSRLKTIDSVNSNLLASKIQFVGSNEKENSSQISQLPEEYYKSRGLEYSEDNVLGLSSILLEKRGPTPEQVKEIETNLVATPATVKVYSSYCTIGSVDIAGFSTTFDKELCNIIGAGTGFFISSDGYLATNGHVVLSRFSELLIGCSTFCEDSNVYSILDSIMSTQANNKLLIDNEDFKYWSKFNFKSSNFPDIETVRLELSIISDLIETRINPNQIKYTGENTFSGYAIGLNQEPISINKDTTDVRDVFNYDENVLKANLVAYNYDPENSISIDADGSYKFTGSDVAILKVNGDNFPSLALSKSNLALSTGSNVTILGYPGDAEALTDPRFSTVTITGGKITSLKYASGSSYKLLQTDASIDHGNSGGPALTDNGEVIGIATYAYTGSSGGTFNYLRDVKDLIDLLDKNNINYSKSYTSNLFASALSKFKTAQYSSAKKELVKLKQLYPPQGLVDDLLSEADKSIANGEDMSNRLSIIGIILITAFIFLIISIIIYFISKRIKSSIKKLNFAKSQLPPLSIQYQQNLIPNQTSSYITRQ